MRDTAMFMTRVVLSVGFQIALDACDPLVARTVPRSWAASIGSDSCLNHDYGVGHTFIAIPVYVGSKCSSY